MSNSVIKKIMKNRYPVAITLAFFSVVFFLFINEKTVLLDRLDKWLYDSLFYFRKPSHKEMVRGEKNPYIPEDIVFVPIDDHSLMENGKWPWPRDIHADFGETLSHFNIESLFFDITFASPSKAPQSFSEILLDDSEMKDKVDKIYTQMDSRFSDALNLFDRVFLSSELLQDSENLNQVELISFESQLSSVTDPLEEREGYYKLALPLYSSFLKNAQPVLVNQFPQRDDILRTSPLLFPYQDRLGQRKLVLSVALALALDYFYSKPEQILLSDKSLIIKKAFVPEVDADNGKSIIVKMPLSEINQHIAEEKATSSSSFFNFLLNEYAFFYPNSGLKALPYPVRIGIDGDDWQILSGQDILDASKTLGFSMVNCIIHRANDFEIPYETIEGKPYSFRISFAGDENEKYKDPFFNEYKNYSPVKQISYSDISGLNLPGIPDLVNQSIDSVDLERYKEWFVGRAERTIWKSGFFLPEDSMTDFSSMKACFEETEPEDTGILLYGILSRGILQPENERSVSFKDISFDDQIEYINRILVSWEMEEHVLLSRLNIFSLLQDDYASLARDLYGAHIFTGYYSKGIAYDLKQTPYGEMFGTSLLINAVSTLVTASQITALSFWVQTGLLILMALVLSIAFSRFPPLLNAVLLLVMFSASYIGAFYLFCMNRTLDLAVFFSVYLFLFLGTTLIRLLFEERDKIFFQTTFSRYLSPDLIREMYESGEVPKLGGESRQITAFFSDIEGFTSISEQLAPVHLVDFLNHYLSSMTVIISQNRGTLDKYIGDAIVAFFGAPYECEDNPLLAVKSALRVQERLSELREEWKRIDTPWAPIVCNMRMRIGLNTGDVITGNMGSSMRMDYTMIGDNVNLAARLESAAKQYCIYTLMSQYTYQQPFAGIDGKIYSVSDFVTARFIDRIIVKGKTEPVDIYEPICLKEDLDEKTEEMLHFFSEGIKKYLARDWISASSLFEKSAELENVADKEKSPSRMYIRRCQHYIIAPPIAEDEEWNGVFVLKNK